MPRFQPDRYPAHEILRRDRERAKQGFLEDPTCVACGRLLHPESEVDACSKGCWSALLRAQERGEER